MTVLCCAETTVLLFDLKLTHQEMERDKKNHFFSLWEYNEIQRNMILFFSFLHETLYKRKRTTQTLI